MNYGMKLGYLRKQEKKEWFDEECATVNEEKNCARARAAKLTAMNEYRQTRRRGKHRFRKKKGQSGFIRYRATPQCSGLLQIL
jgi:hypothetical protein